MLESGHLAKGMTAGVRRLLVRAGHDIDLLQLVRDALLVQRETNGTNIGADRGTMNDGLTHELLLREFCWGASVATGPAI
jgi:hypothetical protein